jgi:uncharacterized protein (TIGR00255 family)
MTGQGEGRCQVPLGGTFLAEARSVNNRHLKVNLRGGEGLMSLENDIEALVRTHVRRGTVTLTIVWSGRPSLDLFQLQQSIMESYLQQCRQIAAQLGVDNNIGMSDLLQLPGVVLESMPQRDQSPELLEAICTAVNQALSELNHMRAREGDSMARELKEQIKVLSQLVDTIEERAPSVLSEYRERLKTRVSTLVAEAISAGDVTPLAEPDLIREVALMSDKADIREEIVRLRSHFDQFNRMLAGSESQGRKLDFLVQEIFRESNTIGSKASDAFIAQRVVDFKATLEQIRELIQNVE